jgi:hypothetical protein
VKIYLAGRFEARERLKAIRDRLRVLGHQVVSTWMDEESAGAPDDTAGRYYALRDLAELRQANALFLDTLDADDRGGREAEWGYSLGRMYGERVIVGPATGNIFHALATRRFPTWEDCFVWLTA